MQMWGTGTRYLSVLSVQFFCKPKIALSIKSINLKKKSSIFKVGGDETKEVEYERRIINAKCTHGWVRAHAYVQIHAEY